ncbi:hypothetical protein FE257_009795 [Aspergillus nanangensis]|uniref:Xylanolytic transcriptional activator regulatory domain-containing protein n=1 Tax=Aspergillus nanangensis TaxID=2582783 RepID=A0AAD4CKT5_ASPNN|nr:hypothetical protein FE257_009795 [Aspergillus nanangensis]
MELTWLADTPQSRRRTRALRACPQCQRRKCLYFSHQKRCRHLGTENGTPLNQLLTTRHIEQNNGPDTSSPPPVNPSRSNYERGLEITMNPSPDTSRTERFVGDLNPEAMIREKLGVAHENQLRDRIGLWISSPNSTKLSENQEGYPNASTGRPAARSPTPESVACVLQQRYSSALKACERIPSSTRDQLISIYFARVNHILPLVDRESFLLNYRLAVALNEGFESDRITRIRALALLSLHCEGYEGAEAASMHLCQAIHQAQTVGLHLDRPGRISRELDLFWCLWTLDKMHACIGGRPVLFADRDIGAKKPGSRASESRTAFDIWLAISDLLSNVISFYRPTTDPMVGWETNFPTFEEIIGDNVRDDLDFATLGFLELFYHAVGILSCRYKLSDRPDGSKPSYIRQGLAAIRIHSIVATECPQGLPPLPILPYALALSMGVSYQHFRSSRLITHFDRAKASLEACCSLLEGLGVFWYSAEATARLGRKALHQIEEVKPEFYRNIQVSRDFSVLTAAADNSAPVEPIPASQGDPESFVNMSLPSASTETHSGADSLDPPSTFGFQNAEADGFADIDMLFGDFLDLSLPTNFWDPIYFTEDQGGS